MSQTNQSEQFRILKQYIEQKDFDNFNGFLDNNEISKKTLNSLLCFTLQNYRSNYEMTDYIQLLIEKGAEQNSMFHNKSSTQGPRIDEKDNVSILMYSCIYADIRLIDLIVTEKNINLKDKNGKNALFYVLNDKGDNTDVLDALLYHQIDFECVGRIDMGDKNFENHTPLSLAASKNMIHSFKILIDKGANPNFKIIQTGDTILHIAVKKGNLEMVKLLLDTNKIKFEEKNKENKTALDLALELNYDNIYKLIKEKIEEGNRQGDIIAKELLTEDKKNLIKKQEEVKNINFFNENINTNINNINKPYQIMNEKINISNKKKKITKEKLKDERHNNKIKLFNKYFHDNINSPANLDIHLSLSDIKENSNIFFNSEINKENIPTLTIDLLSKEFNEYNEYYNIKKNEEKERKKIIEEENIFIKKKLEALTESNNILLKKLNENEFQMQEMKNRHKLEIIELKNKISFLEKEHDNDKLIISDLKKQINKYEKNENDINRNYKNENNQSLINYLNKKFVSYEYNFDFFQNKEKDSYILNCLSKDISEYEKFVTTHISSSSHIYKSLLSNVEMAVNESISEYEVHLYGSHATNLCLPWSDLDIVLIPKNINRNNINENNHALLSKLYENLRNKKWVKDINYISNASIPIIKIYTIETYNNIPIDISIQEENHFGLKCVELVKQYMNQFESLKPLVLSIKNILKRANLNDPYKGGISSYGLILMIVYFLKQQSFAGIDISLGENNNNLGQLFFGFLHFYSYKFEFGKNIIYIKNNSNDLDDLKYQNISLNSKLIIIDPLNVNNNVAKSCFQSFGIKLSFIISLNSLYEDCECGCHYAIDNKEYNNETVEHCFLKRIFNAVRRLPFY